MKLGSYSDNVMVRSHTCLQVGVKWLELEHYKTNQLDLLLLELTEVFLDGQ